MLCAVNKRIATCSRIHVFVDLRYSLTCQLGGKLKNYLKGFMHVCLSGLLKYPVRHVRAMMFYFAVCQAVHKCCPQPENDDAEKCGCCPKPCCCICEQIVVPGMTAMPTTTIPTTTDQSKSSHNHGCLQR